MSYGDGSLLEWAINDVQSNTIEELRAALLAIPDDPGDVDLASGLGAAAVELQEADW